MENGLMKIELQQNAALQKQGFVIGLDIRAIRSDAAGRILINNIKTSDVIEFGLLGVQTSKTINIYNDHFNKTKWHELIIFLPGSLSLASFFVQVKIKEDGSDDIDMFGDFLSTINSGAIGDVKVGSFNLEYKSESVLDTLVTIPNYFIKATLAPPIASKRNGMKYRPLLFDVGEKIPETVLQQMITRVTENVAEFGGCFSIEQKVAEREIEIKKQAK